jgi:hypothetical protein
MAANIDAAALPQNHVAHGIIFKVLVKGARF